MSILRSARRRRLAAALALCSALGLGACTAAPEPTATPAPSSPTAESTPATQGTPTAQGPTPSAAVQLVIPIEITHDSVDPNAKKIDVAKGTTIVLEVSSEIDDEIHAHTGGDGYELEVSAGKPARGEFVVDETGSFEVESHHLEKVIVILNVR